VPDDAAFRGFSPEAIQFLADLALNNDRAWFQPRKAEYERLLKEPMEALMTALAERFATRGIPLHADPRRSPFRIYRDTRFSRDKSPYKTHLGASLPWVGDTVGRDGAAGAGVPDGAGAGVTAEPAPTHGAHASGGYFNFQPGEMYVGGGMWMPDRVRLDGFRRALRDDPDRVMAVLEEPAFKAWFGGVHSHEELRRVPPGYPADHPRADLFRWKDVVFGRRLSDDEVCAATLPDLLADGYATAVPVLRFLAALG
jgi:uncharacterized protein (DUF2461 family)